MKKLFYIGIGALITILAFGVVGFAFAQAQTPPAPQPPVTDGTTQTQPGWGIMGGWMHRGNLPGLAARVGMMNGRQGFRQGMMSGYAQGMVGPMHEAMLAALAGKLGLSVDELQAKIDAGETPLEIAKAQGLTDDQIQEFMEQAHDEALKAAVAAGVLTQEQADAMDQRMESMWQNGMMSGRMLGGFGRGGCPGMGAQNPQP